MLDTWSAEPMATQADLVTIYERVQESLRGELAYSYGCDPADAEDAIQDAAAYLLASKDEEYHFTWRKRTSDSLEGLFRQCAHHRLRNKYRTGWNRQIRKLQEGKG